MSAKGIPRAGIRVGIGLQAVAVLVLFAAVNFFSFNNYVRVDNSRSQKFALASQTKRVFRELKKPAEITVIASRTLASPATQIYGDIKNLLDEFQFSGREKIQVEYVDPTRDLSRMRELQAKYKFTSADNVLIISYDGRNRFVGMLEMADFDFRPVAQGEAPRLIAFRGEQALTGALMGLLRPEDQTVYLLQGHGEPALNESTPIAVLLDYLGKQSLKVEPLSLAAADAIPANAGAVLIIAPRTDLEEREAAVLQAWMKQRGRMLVLLDPDAPTPRLRGLIGSAGIVPRDDRVLRTVKLSFATGILRDVTAEVLPATEWTKRLVGTTVLFPGATQSLFLDEKFAAEQKIQLRALVAPMEEFWGETDFALNQPEGVAYQDGIDHGQPLVIAASADRGGVADDRVEVQTSRLIVVGSSQFVMDSAIKPSGLDLVLGAVNSLLDRSRIAGVAPKSVTHFSLDLTERQLGLIALFSMVLLPGAAAVCGVAVWWRRRS